MSDSEDISRLAQSVRDQCLALHLQRAMRVVTRAYDAAFRPLDITSGQFSILVSLLQHTPPTVSGLAAQLSMDRTTMTANLKPLERRGLVESAADPQDGRSRTLRLTETGRKLVDRALPIWEGAQSGVPADLRETEALRVQLRRLAFPE